MSVLVSLSLFAGAGFQFFTNNGIPLVGGKINTYVAGTTTPAITYSDSTGDTENTNPIITNSAGRPAAQDGTTPIEIWLDSSVSYKFVVTDANDVAIVTCDNITGYVNTITGTIHQVIVSAPTGDIVISTPQDIDVGSSVQFLQLDLVNSGLTTLLNMGDGTASSKSTFNIYGNSILNDDELIGINAYNNR